MERIIEEAIKDEYGVYRYADGTPRDTYGEELNQEQINSMFEARLKRLEVYLQREGHDIVKYD